MDEDRVDTELLDQNESVVLRGTARVLRDDISGSMMGVDDYRTAEGRPLEAPDGHRWVLKLKSNSGEVPRVRLQVT